jgi:hypothetical protein
MDLPTPPPIVGRFLWYSIWRLNDATLPLLSHYDLNQ